MENTTILAYDVRLARQDDGRARFTAHVAATNPDQARAVATFMYPGWAPLLKRSTRRSKYAVGAREREMRRAYLATVGRPQPVDCRVCGGDGYLDSLPTPATCPYCQGTGKESR
jgi:hypothetical protein